MRAAVIFVCVLLCHLMATAQITERQRPAEWVNLVEGARFLDRFLPMPAGQQGSGIWGTDSVQNRYIDNGIERPDISFWGGNILQTPDGIYHLYVCGWPESSPKGHMFWASSTIYHAESETLSGPYVVKNSIGAGHNPEAFRLADGRIVVYDIMDGFHLAGYYIADNERSLIWNFQKLPLDTRDRPIIEGSSNMTFACRPDQSYLMLCRGGGVWISRDGISPYQQISSHSIYPPVEGEFEDPVIWRDSLQYHMIVNDWYGRIAFYQRSLDGLHWVTEQGEAYVPGISVHLDGEKEAWFKYERPKVFQDEYGRAIQMNFAVIDTIKAEDLPGDRHSSKNICIPLNKGLLLDVLNTEPITASTRYIELLIKAEPGFDPATDIDIQSLRFGSYNEVNFGRGCKAHKVRRQGDDLIVVFKAKGSGITVDEFAPKLIGKSSAGQLLYGYARLPYVDYSPAMLSARKPKYDHDKRVMQVTVENYGLSASAASDLQLLQGGEVIAQASIPALEPYGSALISFTPTGVQYQHAADCEVVITTEGKEIERVVFSSRPQEKK